MIDRIKNILLSPKTEWPKIDAEPMTEKGIFLSWVLPLAAIGPVAGLIGQQLLGGGSFMGISWKPSLGFSVSVAVTGYIMSLIGTFLMAKIIDALAPTFGGVKNPVAALKVVAFSWTAAWLAGIFTLMPSLAILSLLGLYSLYLLYLGLPVLMKAPSEKALGYTVVAFLCAIVMFVIISTITGAVSKALMPEPDLGSITIPAYQ
ncbi:Yip1 family protein [Sphingomonas sp.]|uniref:Yip1 family protein n=1 Tax=Sphingomonas sp. TaxID=28214 RepID=UPI002DD6B556|nr:Yip1 family protein [Sphingomonas sp.]